MIRKSLASIALLSLTLLSTELFWTRIFSAEFFYTFAFLVLSLAILGLGLGALFLRLLPSLDRPVLLPVWLLATGLLFLAGVPAVFSLGLDFSKLFAEPVNLVKMVSAILILGSGYFFAGMALASLFKTGAMEMPRLYRADLFGAALGVPAFVLVMNALGGEATLVFCALPVLTASFLMGVNRFRIAPVLVLLGALVYLGAAGGLPEQKREERAPVVYKHWDATAKIKVFEYDSTARGINIDNVANSPVYRFDGNWDKPDSLKFGFNVDVSYLMKKFDGCRFLSLGAGGGGDVLQALQYNAAEVHAVEVIPHINEMMKEGFLRDYSGNIYNDPRVVVVTEDARAYVRKFRNRFDIIYSLSSNSWAAFASGSFALAENYLFTTEAFVDYWRALSDHGFLSIEHQFYTPRLVAELLDALQSLGVENPGAHLAVYNLPALRRKLLLVSRDPLDPETIQNAYGKLTPESSGFIHLLYPPREDNAGNIINAIVRSGWRAVADTARIDVSPCTDDRPFVAQLGLMRNFDPSALKAMPLYEFTGFPLSRVILLVILAVCILLIVPLNLLPYLRKGEKLRGLPWLYFFAIGAGYMTVEVILIQQYTLFVGASLQSIALILTVLLASSGIGSRHALHVSPRIVFAAIVCWLLADVLIFRHLFSVLGDWALLPRMSFTALLIAPLGYFMGMPFPRGATAVPLHVDWAFAVTGSASVMGSVLAVLIASSWGYGVALLVAAVSYLAAFFLSNMMRWGPSEGEEGTT